MTTSPLPSLSPWPGPPFHQHLFPGLTSTSNCRQNALIFNYDHLNVRPTNDPDPDLSLAVTGPCHESYIKRAQHSFSSVSAQLQRCEQFSDILQYDGNVSLLSSNCEEEVVPSLPLSDNYPSLVDNYPLAPSCFVYVENNSIDCQTTQQIRVRITNRPYQPNQQRRKLQVKPQNLKTIRRERKTAIVSELPRVMVINPRSIYNRVDEFSKIIYHYNIQVSGISESWERESLPLKDLIKIPNYRVLTNACQHLGRGEKPALIKDESQFHI